MAERPTSLLDLITNIAVMIGATEAAVFAMEPDVRSNGRRVTPLIHIRPDENDEVILKAAIEAFKDLIEPCVEQVRDGAIEVGEDPKLGKQFCLVTLAARDKHVYGAAAFIVRTGDTCGARILLDRVQQAATGW